MFKASGGGWHRPYNMLPLMVMMEQLNGDEEGDPN